jgi:hypothetical protein
MCGRPFIIVNEGDLMLGDSLGHKQALDFMVDREPRFALVFGFNDNARLMSAASARSVIRSPSVLAGIGLRALLRRLRQLTEWSKKPAQPPLARVKRPKPPLCGRLPASASASCRQPSFLLLSGLCPLTSKLATAQPINWPPDVAGGLGIEVSRNRFCILTFNYT